MSGERGTTASAQAQPSITTQPPVPVQPSIARAVVAPILLAYVATSAALVAIGLLLTNNAAFSGIRAWDDDVTRWIVDGRADGLDTFISWAGRVADTVPVVVAALVVEAVLVLRRRFADLLVLAVGLALELAVFLTVNYLVQRPRPDVAKLGGEPGTYSFPSGHIAATVVLWGGVALLLSRGRQPVLAVVTWIVAVLAAAIVGFSRVYRGMHHLLDVLAGAAVGVVALTIGALVSLRVAQLAAARTDPSDVPDERVEVAV